MNGEDRTTPHGRAIGAAIGNRRPDPTAIPGASRSAGVLLEYGDLETQVGIQAAPLSVFERQRGHLRTIVTFSHEGDAERYLLVRAYPGMVYEPWDGGDTWLWPAGVQGRYDRPRLTARWSDDDGEHVVETTRLGEYDSVSRLTWVRSIPVPELLQRAMRQQSQDSSAPPRPVRRTR